MSDHTSMRTGRICFDVTDIVSYATGNLRVSGIQRVQLNLISNIARNNPGAKILCTFFHPTLLKMVSFRPLEVLVDHEFDAPSILQRLGINSKAKLLPPKHEVKKYLSRFSSNKPLRSLKKLEVYFYAIFYSHRLRQLGFKPAQTHPSKIECVKLEDLRLLKEDSYVILGSNWSFKEVINLCKAHSAYGGDVVQMVYDLIPYVRPEYCTSGLRTDFKNWLTDVSSYVNRYICISEFTAKDLREFLGPKAAGKSIKAVPLAHEFDGYARHSPPITPSEDIEHVLRKPFVLCVGTIEIRKNGVALLRVWSRLIEILGEETPKLIFAGKQGWLVKEFENTLRVSKKLSRFVEVIQSPSDAELATLYQNALFTAYPSLYEGWGLPVGEAAWFGKLCIASNTTSMPEVCGDMAIYVDPEDIDEMTAKIGDAIRRPEIVIDKENLIQHAKLRTWSDVADDIFEFLDDRN